MATEKFNFIKPAVAHGDNIKLQSQAFGDKVDSKLRSEATGPNVQPAGLLSTAPYKPPTKNKQADADGDGLMKDETGRFTKYCPGLDGKPCNGWATKKTGYCAGHSKKLGLL